MAIQINSDISSSLNKFTLNLYHQLISSEKSNLIDFICSIDHSITKLITFFKSIR